MFKNIRLGQLPIIIGCQVFLWYFIIHGFVIRQSILLLLQLFFSVTGLYYLQKVTLHRYFKFLLNLFNCFSIDFSLLLILLPYFISLFAGFSETTYLSPSGRHSITIHWNPISGSNTVYRTDFLTEQYIGPIYTKAKFSAENSTQIHWSDDESAVLWKFEEKQGVLKL